MNEDKGTTFSHASFQTLWILMAKWFKNPALEVGIYSKYLVRRQGEKHWLFSWAIGNGNGMLNLNFGYQKTV